MAIRKDLTIEDYGLNLPKAYAKVDQVTVNNKGKVIITVAVYSDKNARDNNRLPILTLKYEENYDPLMKNPIEHGYEKIKRKPEWAGGNNV